jgi:cytoskeletal protein RodZ
MSDKVFRLFAETKNIAVNTAIDVRKEKKEKKEEKEYKQLSNWFHNEYFLCLIRLLFLTLAFLFIGKLFVWTRIEMTKEFRNRAKEIQIEITNDFRRMLENER